MGGLGSGGSRSGAGRKRKDAIARSLDGGADRRARVLPHPNVPVATPVPDVVDEFDAPNDLTRDERVEWLKLAPFAFKNRTLTPETSYAFQLLCQNVVLLRRYAASVQDAGGANHRGLIQRVDAELLRFRLAPSAGKQDLVDAGVTVDPMKEKYFGGGRNSA